MSAPAAYALAPGIWRIPVAPSDGINAFVLRGDDGQVTLIDAGLPFGWKRLVAGLTAAGVDVRDVTKVLVTHAHNDHVGNVARVVRESQAPVSAHRDDASYLTAGRVPSIEQGGILRPLLSRWARYEPIGVDSTFGDGELLDIAGGLRVLHTPGHTPGHTSYFHEPTGVLITGDVIHFYRGTIRIGMKMYCHDISLNERSAQRLAEPKAEVVAFTHGAHLSDAARPRLHSFLAERLRRNG
ncbi:MAG TPA: MBL fold metallo-hydrolase [Actinobacteria bacterium]|nr:MBL fold metallo-hydrolase [Actinomycetota bacterium]HCK79685.1 MBL fold metallo-hydrolase [Actinomycetota bacterium]